MKNKLIFLIPLTITALVVSFLLFSPREKKQTEKIIKLGELKILAEVAETEWEKTRGLSGRVSLSQDRGMLFVFDDKKTYSFWMKEMKFPLDFVWIDGDKVVDITQNVPYPKDNEKPVSIAPRAPVDKVLEVNAGAVESSGAKIGDTVSGL